MLNYRLKNYFSVLVFCLGVTFANAQKTQRIPAIEKGSPANKKAGVFIDVNVPPYPASNYSAAQLVTDVLIAGGGSCTVPNVSNVVVSPNAAVSNTNRPWGYFNKGTATFPFAEGIVLSTGYARNAGNALAASNSDNLENQFGNTGDVDLATAINVNNSNLNDAVYLEFDFVPTSTEVKFNYIFASEEYTSGFPCSFTDGFALLLKPNTPGSTYTNLAVLPGGLGPVSVTNIRPTQTSCAAQNPSYFAGQNSPVVGHNFNGSVIPLTARATVVPGQSYHIKMVLADYTDNSYDSAVFLEAGSFEIGVQILGPGGVALPPTINMCDNAPQTLTSSIQLAGATYQWTLNGAPISGATGPTYVATQPGVYCLSVTVPGNSCPGEACVTIVGGTSPVVNNITYTQCYGPGNVNFNLNLITTAISSTPGVTYAFYQNLADAQAQNANVIANPGAFSSPGNVTVYALVKSGFCPKIAEIQLVKAPQITVDIAPPPAINCTNPQVTLLATSSTYPAGSVFSWVATNGGYIFSGANTLTPVVAAGGNYTLTITKAYQPGDVVCSATGTVTVQENFTPPTVTVSASDMKVCAGYPVVLTATGGATYVWNTNASPLNVITVAPTQTTTYTVYSVGANGCQSTNPATITIEVIPAITTTLQPVAGQICVGDSIILDAGAGPAYTYEWKDEDDIVIGNSQTVTVDEMGIYTVTIGNGECTATFSTQVVQAQIPQVINADFQTNTLTLTASNPSNGPLEYSIDNGFTWQDSNVFTNVAANITLNLQVRVKHTSCVGELPFFTLHIQNVITPNGDGVNDVLDLSGISRYKDFGASVYDRYGKEIWRATKDAAIWTGRFQSKTLPTSTYWYQVKYEDPANKNPINKTGWIMLKNRE